MAWVLSLPPPLQQGRQALLPNDLSHLQHNLQALSLLPQGSLPTMAVASCFMSKLCMIIPHLSRKSSIFSQVILLLLQLLPMTGGGPGFFWTILAGFLAGPSSPATLYVCSRESTSFRILESIALFAFITTRVPLLSRGDRSFLFKRTRLIEIHMYLLPRIAEGY